MGLLGYMAVFFPCLTILLRREKGRVARGMIMADAGALSLPAPLPDSSPNSPCPLPPTLSTVLPHQLAFTDTAVCVPYHCPLVAVAKKIATVAQLL